MPRSPTALPLGANLGVNMHALAHALANAGVVTPAAVSRVETVAAQTAAMWEGREALHAKAVEARKARCRARKGKR